MATSDYIGKICPYCKSPFQEGDDIVICSVCEMPHHKDCWVDNQGCTTFGCSGTIESPKNTPADNLSLEIDVYDGPRPATTEPENSAEYRYCTKCGAQNFASSAFCGKCGNPLTKPVQQQTPPKYSTSVSGNDPYSYVQPGYYPGSEHSGYHAQSQYQTPNSENRTNIEMLIGKNTEYYVPRFNNMDAHNTKHGWNWCAFLFTPYWMIYRKMYGYGAAVLGGLFFLSLVKSAFISSFVTPAVNIVFGILGNYLYKQDLEKRAQQLVILNGSYQTDYIQKKSGTDTTATVLTVIGYTILNIIIQLI